MFVLPIDFSSFKAQFSNNTDVHGNKLLIWFQFRSLNRFKFFASSFPEVQLQR